MAIWNSVRSSVSRGRFSDALTRFKHTIGLPASVTGQTKSSCPVTACLLTLMTASLATWCRLAFGTVQVVGKASHREMRQHYAP